MSFTLPWCPLRPPPKEKTYSMDFADFVSRKRPKFSPAAAILRVNGSSTGRARVNVSRTYSTDQASDMDGDATLDDHASVVMRVPTWKFAISLEDVGVCLSE